jgi:hypothetical protein
LLYILAASTSGKKGMRVVHATVCCMLSTLVQV